MADVLVKCLICPHSGYEGSLFISSTCPACRSEGTVSVLILGPAGLARSFEAIVLKK